MAVKNRPARYVVNQSFPSKHGTSITPRTAPPTVAPPTPTATPPMEEHAAQAPGINAAPANRTNPRAPYAPAATAATVHTNIEYRERDRLIIGFSAVVGREWQDLNVHYSNALGVC